MIFDTRRDLHEKKRRKFKIFLGLIVILALAGFGYSKFGPDLFKSKTNDPKNVSENQPNKPEEVKNPDKISLIALGDFIAHDSLNSQAKQSDGSYKYLPMMQDFEPILKKKNIRFCNDPILNGGKALGISGYPKFNSPTEFVDDMGKVGCNLVNTASNHSFDFTQDNIDASVDAWQKVPDMLAIAGQNKSSEQQNEIKYFSINGVKFAFLAYTTYSNRPPATTYGANVFSTNFATKQIAEAKKSGAQFIIASMRWGTEYSSAVNALQKQNAQFLADEGVNLILGHGPHVLQTASELIGKNGNKTIVFYSLGNFINTQLPSETLFNAIIALDIDIKTLGMSNLRFLPIYMHYEWTAEQANNETLNARHNLKMVLLENTTQEMIDANQLNTNVNDQKIRLQKTLSAGGLTIPLVDSKNF